MLQAQPARLDQCTPVVENPPHARPRKFRGFPAVHPQVRPLPGLITPEKLAPVYVPPEFQAQAKPRSFLWPHLVDPEPEHQAEDQVVHQFVLPGMGGETVPSPETCPEGACLIPYEHCCQPSETRVSGYGYSARAALVAALYEDKEEGVARQVAHCASFILHGQREMTLHESEPGKTHLSGLNHCGRIPCPICGSYIMARRLEALSPVMERLSLDKNLRFFYVVMTLRHHLGGRFRQLVRVLRACQRKLVQNKKHWRANIEGWIRVLETTWSKNGHNPHENLVLAAHSDLDAEAFMDWLEKTFAKEAMKHGRTAEWAKVGKDGEPHPWWREVPREELVQTMNYLGSDEKMGKRAPAALREELGGAHKHQPVWCMPSKPFAEVWDESKGMRWFGVGGIFKTAETDKTDEEINDEREETKPAIGYVPQDVFRTWTGRELRDRQAILTDRTLTTAQKLEYFVAVGGILGPPPAPDWGDRAAPPDCG